jgi:hypothetical protein
MRDHPGNRCGTAARPEQVRRRKEVSVPKRTNFRYDFELTAVGALR